MAISGPWRGDCPQLWECEDPSKHVVLMESGVMPGLHRCAYELGHKRRCLCDCGAYLPSLDNDGDGPAIPGPLRIDGDVTT